MIAETAFFWTQCYCRFKCSNKTKPKELNGRKTFNHLKHCSMSASLNVWVPCNQRAGAAADSLFCTAVKKITEKSVGRDRDSSADSRLNHPWCNVATRHVFWVRAAPRSPSPPSDDYYSGIECGETDVSNYAESCHTFYPSFLNVFFLSPLPLPLSPSEARCLHILAEAEVVIIHSSGHVCLLWNSSHCANMRSGTQLA